jgi:predicted metal-dependent HD superfamily phosphohydrolase
MSDMVLRTRLKSRWTADTLVTGNERAADRCFDGIVASYSEPHRAYHTLEHLGFIFDKLAAHAVDAQEPGRLAFAAWYHDIVYDPAAKDNEERSALRATAELTELGADPGLVARVALLIRATAAHTKGGADSDDDLFLDADFAILGADPQTYRRYIANVRREYAAISDAGWRTGRGAFLTGALAQPRIFRTERFEAAYGAQARDNMTAELGAL